MIHIAHATKWYGSQQVVKDVSLTIQKHTLTTLIGSNGAGKSTLLSLIGRLIEGEGTFFLEDRDIASYRGNDLAKRLAMLKQTNHLAVRLTIKELVRFGRFPYSKTRLTQEDEAIVEQAIDYMDLKQFEHKYLDQLSGGERQRAMIAMVIAQNTDYILLDEPLNNLDMAHSVHIMKLL
ncbi:MAG: ATP-binding cassette domain-containing protein, partial [Sphaerochaetaceae bacterium]